jgi:large subunit ribosomal protein L21
MKAVVKIGSQQYLVAKGDELTVNGLASGEKRLNLEPLLVIDAEKTSVGTPTVPGAKVVAEVKEEGLGPKTTSIRYKAKKRVKKIRGARQKQAKIVITGVTLSKSK